MMGLVPLPPLAVVVMVLALAGGALLGLTEFTTVASVDVQTPSAAGERVGSACDVINDSDPSLADRCELSGFERHGGALLLLGILAMAMGVGAARGASRPAAVALMVIGALTLAWSLILDLPQTKKTGAIGQNFEGAVGRAGTGLTLEIVGALLLLAAGSLALWRGAAGSEGR